MSVSYGFFNATLVEGDYDRKYTADQLAEFFSYLLGNGVSGSIENSFKVVPGSGFTVKVSEGFGWIKGFWIKNDSDLSIVDTAVSPSGYRKDLIVLRFKRTERSITPLLIQGEVSQSSPATQPAYKRTSDEYDLVLAEISIEAGDSSITASMITDLRSDEVYCGIVDTFSARLIPNGSIHSESLAEQSVTTLKIALGAVTTDRIADDSIAKSKLKAASIDSSKLEDSSVIASKIAAGAVGTDKLAEGTVSETKLATDSVTTDKIHDEAVTEAKLAADSVTFNKLAGFSTFQISANKTIKLNTTADSRAILMTISEADSSNCIYAINSRSGNVPEAVGVANAGVFTANATAGYIEITPANSAGKQCLLIVIAGSVTKA